ncbi:MAG: porphobilinogen synthase [Rickettsiaceae bacterium]|nr:porphobilinogen synthase [Rickettsiaceae bacterium]
MYPIVRLRRNRKHDWLRSMVAEHSLSASNLILPIFVIEGEKKREEIKTMPSVYRLSIDEVCREAKKAADLGIKAIALFPVVSDELKSDDAEEAYNLDNLICRTVRSIKNAGINIGIICDVALDPYTQHGHDGIVKDGDVDNDETIEALCNQALVLAKAGADIVAPSDMMDGRIGAIRDYLDEEGFENLPILAYAVKYASSFYGPFRCAVDSDKSGKICKKTYQMDPRNIDEAIREIELDIEEGADIVMVKPGMPYLDVIHAAAQNFTVPVFAYQVSGEYAMIKCAANAGCFDFKKAMLESLIAFRRAGARVIFTYAAIEVAQWLREEQNA